MITQARSFERRVSSENRMLITPSKPTKPFLKWPGGKRWLTSHIVGLLDGCRFRRYFEPFLGGGALFFAFEPREAVLSDINWDLINTYIQVRRRPMELIACLRQLPVNEATYRSLRNENPKQGSDRAVRFLYLNRTAFGGIYRLNRNVDFNVPFGGGGRTPAPLWEENLLISASRRLRNASLICGDFENVLAEARAGDLVYCDPTYTVTHDNNGFVRYNERNFCWDDQKRLAATCQQVAKRGATVLVSNADHEKVLELYHSCEVRQFDRMSLLCPDSRKRRPTKELLFVIRPGKNR